MCLCVCELEVDGGVGGMEGGIQFCGLFLCRLIQETWRQLGLEQLTGRHSTWRAGWEMWAEKSHQSTAYSQRLFCRFSARVLQKQNDLPAETKRGSVCINRTEHRAAVWITV